MKTLNIIATVLLQLLVWGSGLDSIETIITLPVKPLDLAALTLVINAAVILAGVAGIKRLRAARIAA